MAIRELDAGQSHTFAPTALRVQLTGASHGGGMILRALDQAGDESVTVRLTDVEVVLTPQPRRLRLVALPSAGGWFPAGTSLGLTLRTEGASSAGEQILISSVDVGALTRHEIAVLEFAADRAVLRVSGTSGGIVPTELLAEAPFTSGSVFRLGQPNQPTLPPPDDQRHTWLQPGRYALRDAERLGAIGEPVGAWGVVLDGSASMRPLYESGQLHLLLGLVCGTYVQWTNRWASVSSVAGVRVTDVDAATDPEAITAAAFVGTEPSSWSSLADAAQGVVRRVGQGGAVLMVTDGVPGDIVRLAALGRDNPSVRFVVVTTGVSVQGLPSDVSNLAWWQEELAGFDVFRSLANFQAVAVQLPSDQRFELSGSRAAELALRLTAPLSIGALA
jgi:hypothetical protein